jgi:hypothetical protein
LIGKKSPFFNTVYLFLVSCHLYRWPLTFCFPSKTVV